MVNSPLAATFLPEDTGHPPLLDRSALDALLAELDQDGEALDGFLGAFIGHWPERVRRTEADVIAMDRSAIHDSALSIKVSSEMVGALRLSALGGELESLVHADRLDDAPAVLEAIRAAGEQTLAALVAARGEELAA